MNQIESVRVQKKALEIIASFATAEVEQTFLKAPLYTEEDALSASIEMVRVPKAIFDAVLTSAMDTIAQQSGGKWDTQKELAAALIDPDAPIPDTLVGSLMSYAGHWRELDVAARLCRAFRGRRLTRFEDPEMTEYFQVDDYLKGARRMASFQRKLDRIRDCHHA